MDKVKKIINEAFSEALSSTTKSYRDIWVEMMGKLMDLKVPGTSKSWRHEDPRLQDEVGEAAGASFQRFLEMIASIEAVIAEGERLH